MEHPFNIRPADVTDVAAIYAIIAEVADCIPVGLNTPEHIEAMKTQIMDYCGDGLSVVAVDANGLIVGFQLARTETWFDEPYIHLRYAGVTANALGKKVFRRLIEAMKKHGAPLAAEVMPNNQSEMAKILHHYGFRSDASGPRDYRWGPL